jgi:hypothetical protein
MSKFVPTKKQQGRQISTIASEICPFASFKVMEFGLKILTVHKILMHQYLSKVYLKNTLTYFQTKFHHRPVYHPVQLGQPHQAPKYLGPQIFGPVQAQMANSPILIGTPC